MPGDAPPAVIKSLLLTDLVDSTRLFERLGDRRAAEVSAECDRVARGLLDRFHGREIDKTDGFLLLFDRPIDAIRYTLSYHSALVELSERTGLRLAGRAGVCAPLQPGHGCTGTVLETKGSFQPSRTVPFRFRRLAM